MLRLLLTIQLLLTVRLLVRFGTVVSVLRSLRNCYGGEACQLEARSLCYCCGCDKAMALS